MNEFLTNYQPPGDKQPDLEEVEECFNQIEAMVKLKAPRGALREQALVRLFEASLLCKEAIKGRDIDPPS